MSEPMRNLTFEEARARAALLDVHDYAVHLTLDEGEHFASRTTVRFRSGAGRSFLELDGELLEGDLDGRPLTQEGNRLWLDLEEGEHTATVAARCHTTGTGEGLVRSVDPADGAVYVYGQSFLDDAQRIFACFDQPDLKATFALTVDAPESWVVRGNTRATVSERGHHEFEPTERMPPYLFSVAGGPWHGRTARHGDLELGVWCRASLEPHFEADEILHVTAQCLDFQQPLFGRPMPFGTSYDQVFVPDFNAGAMENAGLVTFADEYFVPRSRSTRGERRLRAQVIAHELAHMWFGNLVTMRWWDDLWLNEAFAEYMGVLTTDRATDYDGAWEDFALARKAWGYRADSLPTTHPIAGPVPDNRAALLNFDGISYAKGASALRQLSAYLGEDVFFAGVRRYLDRHAWGNTSLADLLDRARGGERPRPRRLGPVVAARVRHHDAPDARRRARAGRRPPAPRARRPVRRAGRCGGSSRCRWSCRARSSRSRPPTWCCPTTATSPSPRCGSTSGRWRRCARPCTPSTTRSPGRWSGARCGTARATPSCHPATWSPRCWPTSRARRTPTWSAGCSPRPAPRPSRWAGSADLEAALHAHHVDVRVEPGSDLQLVYFRAAVTTARGPVPVPDGLTEDEDLRWRQLRRLAELGQVTAAELEAAHADEPSSASQNHLAYALAALPDADRKQAVWDELTGTGELPNSRGRSLAEGFWQHGQDALLGVVRRPVRRRPARHLVPPTPRPGRHPHPAAVPRDPGRRRGSWTAPRRWSPTTPSPASVRMVLESRDDLERALRSRALA